MIYLICNNAGLKIDGIGDYTSNLHNAIASRVGDDNVNLFSGDSGHKGRFEQLTSLVMTKVLLSLYKKIKEGDTVIIEYPFAECNILVLLILKLIKKRLVKRNGHILLSLHEYFRTNAIRRFLTRRIVSCVDGVFVTDTATKAWVAGKYIDKPTYIRTIPSNIFCEGKESVPKDKKLFVFFGLISKTKAFDEMIQAWKLFNKDKNCRLLILTSSQCDLSLEECGVLVIRGAEKDSIADYLASAGFCVLPIIPCVSSNNATYKSAIGYNCIPIGVFGEEVGDLSAYIDIRDNTVEELQKGLERAYSLNDEERRHYYSTLDKRPKPTFEVTAKEYLDVINKFK